MANKKEKLSNKESLFQVYKDIKEMIEISPSNAARVDELWAKIQQELGKQIYPPSTFFANLAAYARVVDMRKDLEESHTNQKLLRQVDEELSCLRLAIKKELPIAA